MNSTLYCRCGSTQFVDITNDFTALKGKANAGMMEMEVTGQCGLCGAQAYNSIIGPIDSFKITTGAVGRRR